MNIFRKIFFETYSAYCKKWWPEEVESLAVASPQDIATLEAELIKAGIKLDEISEPEELTKYLPLGEVNG